MLKRIAFAIICGLIGIAAIFVIGIAVIGLLIGLTSIGLSPSLAIGTLLIVLLFIIFARLGWEEFSNHY